MESVENFTPIGSSGKLQDNIALPYQFTIGSLINESWKQVKGVKREFSRGATLLYLLIYAAFIGIGIGGGIYLYTLFNPEIVDVTVPITITKLMAMLITLPLPFGISFLAVLHSR